MKLSSRTLSILAPFLLCAASPASPQVCGTTVATSPVVAQTWTQAGSPYCVTTDLVVSALTIEPGVEVVVDGPWSITVLQITAAGTPVEPITFRPADPSTPWKGIRFQSAPAGSTLAHCVIEGSDDSGLQVVDSSPTIVGCDLRGNVSATGGGGLRAVLSTGDLELVDCLLRDNTTAAAGAAVHATTSNGSALVLTGCVVEENVTNPTEAIGSFRGGGIWVEGDLVLDGTIVRANVVNSRCATFCCLVNGHGAGVHATNGNLSLANCLFTGNVVRPIDGAQGGCEVNQGFGGGVYFDAASGSLAATGCVFVGNTSFLGGSNASGFGSAIFANAGAVTLDHCTLARNGSLTSIATDALYLGAGASATVTNSILYFNDQRTEAPDTYGDQVAGPGSLTVSHSDVQGAAPPPGAGNLAVNPFFAGTGASCTSDVALILGSPCIDAADPAGSDGPCDLPTLGTSAPDMGAFGGPDACAWSLPGRGLSASPSSVSVAAGGTHTLELFVPDHPGGFYFLAGSASGSVPGLSFQGFCVPLNPFRPSFLPDLYLNSSLAQSANELSGNVGFLDGDGRATATVAVPAGASALAGRTLHHAFAVFAPSLPLTVEFVSNATSLELVP